MEKIGGNKIGCLVVWCHEWDSNFIIPASFEALISLLSQCSYSSLVGIRRRRLKPRMYVERLFLFGLLLILTQSHYGHFKLFLDHVFNPIEHQWYCVLKIALNLILWENILFLSLRNTFGNSSSTFSLEFSNWNNLFE